MADDKMIIEPTGTGGFIVRIPMPNYNDPDPLHAFTDADDLLCWLGERLGVFDVEDDGTVHREADIITWPKSTSITPEHLARQRAANDLHKLHHQLVDSLAETPDGAA